MKLKMLILIGILGFSLPVVSLALTLVPPTDSGPIANGGGNANCLMVINPTVADLASTIICLQSRINKLENRLVALESKTTPTPVPNVGDETIGCKYSGNVIICSDGPKPVDEKDGVKIIQDFLKKEGSFIYPTATGHYGPITKEAVKQFQIKQGLTATGLVDNNTLEKMKTLAPTVAPSTSSYMQQVQIP